MILMTTALSAGNPQVDPLHLAAALLRQDWLGDGSLAFYVVVVVISWSFIPFHSLLYQAGVRQIPRTMYEAATIDGAGPWRRFRSIILPLLLVSTAPLAIASFAFNFNNFNIIYMLTGGGPQFPDAAGNIGATDILITVVYKTAFSGVGRDFGLDSALSIVIFLIVATVSALSFSRTKALEEINS